jgi:hypothetical protein
MKLKLNDVVSINRTYRELINQKLEPVVAMDVAENIMATDPLVEKTQKAYKPVDGTKEYNAKVDAVMKELGATPGVNGTWSIPQDKIRDANSKLEMLREDNADFIKAQDEYNKKFDEILEREVDVDIHVLYAEDLPYEIAPGVLLNLLKAGVMKRGRNGKDIS